MFLCGRWRGGAPAALPRPHPPPPQSDVCGCQCRIRARTAPAHWARSSEDCSVAPEQTRIGSPPGSRATHASLAISITRRKSFVEQPLARVVGQLRQERVAPPATPAGTPESPTFRWRACPIWAVPPDTAMALRYVSDVERWCPDSFVCDRRTLDPHQIPSGHKEADDNGGFATEPCWPRSCRSPRPAAHDGSC